MLNDAQIVEAWEALENTPLVKTWPEFKNDYLPRLERIETVAGQQIMREGDPASAFYIVGVGTAQATLYRDGQPWFRWEMKPGDSFGQAALYLNQRQFEVRTSSPAVLYRLRPFDLRGAIERNAKLQEFLLHQELAGRLRRLPLLRTLEDAAILQIAPLVKETSVAVGEEIDLTQEGSLWAIEWGQVMVTGPAALGRPDWRLSAGNFFVVGGANVRLGQRCVAAGAVARYKSQLFHFSAGLFTALATVFPDVRALADRPLDIARYLDDVDLLRGLSSEARQNLAQFCSWMFVPVGQNITTQGQPGYGLVILREGEAVIMAVDDRGRPRPRNYLRAPAAYGETSLLEGKEHDATARATSVAAGDGHPRLDGADVIVLDRRDLNVAFQEDPQRWADYIALMRRTPAVKQAPKQFDWLQEGEKVEWYGRSHWLWLVKPEAGVATALVALLVAGRFASPGLRDELAVFTTIFTAFILLPIAVFIIYNYFDDYYVVTNRRVSRRDHLLLLYNARTESPLEMVQDVTYDADFWGRLFNYGDVNIRSAARVGSIRFAHVPHPDRVRSLIQLTRAEATAGVRGQQHEELRKAVMSGLRLALPIPPLARALGPSETGPGRRSWWARLRGERRPTVLPAMKGTLPGPFVRLANRLPEGVRRVVIGDPAQELQLKEGEFLWRKHIIQLILQAGRPLVLFLVWLVLGWVLFKTELGANQMALHLPWWFVLIFFGSWIVWEYADYRNDLYILREDRIIDIEATPLWLSIKRREGSLDRVQNVFARQEGIWQNLLNYGDVEIQTAAIDEGFNFLKVANPQLVQAIIFQKLDALRSRQAERQVRDRQREIVEGLNVYHELRREGHDL